MKISTPKWIIALIIIVSIFTSCSKGADETIDPTPDPVDGQGVEDMTLHIEKVTTPPTFKDPGNYTIWVGFDSRHTFYYANASNTPQEDFMFSYNIKDNKLTPLTSHDEVCACGYSSKFVTDDSSLGYSLGLYYIANEAWRFNTLYNTWTELDYPDEMHQNNGEAGIVYFKHKIFFLGGRDASNTFKYYDTDADKWGMAKQYLHAVETPDLVVANDAIYSLGGDQQHTLFSYFKEGGDWKSLPTLPFKASNLDGQHTVASFKNRYIFALVNYQKEIQVYDLQEEKWRDEPIQVNLDVRDANLFANSDNLYIAGKDRYNEFTLHKISVDF